MTTPTAPRPTDGNPVIAQATAALQAGRLDEACALFEAAINAWPDDADLYINYSAALFQVGRFDIAEKVARRATELAPEMADAWSNLGISQQARGRTLDAVASYKHAIMADKSHLASRRNLALAYEHLGDVRQAVALLESILVEDPQQAVASFELGRILLSQRQISKALPFLMHASGLLPQDAEVANVLGVALRQAGRGNEAIRHYRRATALRPDFLAAYVNLCRACKEQGYLDASVHAGRTAHRLAPDSPEAINNLASALRSQGKVEEAARLFARASELSADPRPASNWLCAEQYIDTVSRSHLRDIHQRWGDRFATEPPREHFANDSGQDRALRIGFVSPDLGVHPIGYFLSGLLRHLDPRLIETVCYSDRAYRDPLTQELERLSTEWRETARISDAQLAKQVARDRVDVLIDLAGHTDTNRLQVFVDRAAPVQASWLGYVGTTGVPAMDYVIADRIHVRPGEEAAYAEQVLRMPNGYLCYDPPTVESVAPLPAFAKGHVTFGAFHNPAKVSPSTVALWAKVLKAVPGSRLMFKYFGYDSAGVKQHVKNQFARHTVGASRLVFAGPTPVREHLQAFREIDMMLDPLPYSGGLTTCESLWMGVPVVTMPGETFAGRHAASHMTFAGYDEFVADSADEYVAIATEWATDVARLASLRERLRDDVAASRLCDTRQFALDFTDTIRDAWDVHAGNNAASVPMRHRTVA